MKKNPFLSVLLLLVIIALSCKKNNSTNEYDVNSMYNSTIIFNGTKYKAIAELFSDNITCNDLSYYLLITGVNMNNKEAEASLGFTIYKFPNASSGTYQIADYMNSPGCTNIKIIGGAEITGQNAFSGALTSISGTIQKTGIKSFKINASMMDISSKKTFNISIEGSYK